MAAYGDVDAADTDASASDADISVDSAGLASASDDGACYDAATAVANYDEIQKLSCNRAKPV